MRQPKTVEEAAALNEIPSGIWNGSVDGKDTHIFFGSEGLEGDTICAFVDSDGLAKRVECIRRTPDGDNEWVKVRA